MITWPQTLVTEVARRRCIFFLGAGVSASSVNSQGARPKEWSEFLSSALTLVQNLENRATIEKLIAERRYLIALQAISQEANKGDYQDFLTSHFNDPTFEPSRLHQVIFDLDSRLVITTNFDKIYEKLCLRASTEGFKVLAYDSTSLGDELRSDTRLIIKAHGTIDDVGSMIFTKSEYHRATAEHPRFYMMLKALLLTHTCIFIGCSMDDPDVLLLLEDVRVTASSNRPHYALVLKGKNNLYSQNDWLASYNVKALEYGPAHDALTDDLTTLLDQVVEARSTRREA
jgi:hypothetical protein